MLNFNHCCDSKKKEELCKSLRSGAKLPMMLCQNFGPSSRSTLMGKVSMLMQQSSTLLRSQLSSVMLWSYIFWYSLARWGRKIYRGSIWHIPLRWRTQIKALTTLTGLTTWAVCADASCRGLQQEGKRGYFGSAGFSGITRRYEGRIMFLKIWCVPFLLHAQCLQKDVWRRAHLWALRIDFAFAVFPTKSSYSHCNAGAKELGFEP